MAPQAHRKHSVAMRFIVRLEKGWGVRVSAAGKLLVQTTFSDQSYGGKRATLAEAKAWRDAQLERFAEKLSLTPGGRIIRRRHQNNLAGIAGVAPELYRYDRSRIIAWRAGWPGDDGRQRYARFSVVEYGYEKAFQLAVARRCDMVGIPIPDLMPPSERKVLRALG